MQRPLLLREGCYWVSHVLRYRGRLVTEPLVYRHILERLASRVTFEGIKIIGPPVGKGESQPPFLENTVAALRLIQSADPRRFRRVQREIALVEDTPLLASASYRRLTKYCAVDYARYDADKLRQHSEWYAWVYATVLVHEATHGAVYSRHIQYTPRLRERIERLCCAEARRFATRADREDRQWSEVLAPAFNAEGYRARWRMTRWQGLKQLTMRYGQVWRAGRKK